MTMKKRVFENGSVELTAEENRLIRPVGSAEPGEYVRVITVPDEEHAALYEECDAADRPLYSRDDYCREVERLIALRYSHGKETEINRERDEKPERFAEYMDYIGQCKQRAKATLESRAAEERENQESDNN